MANVVIANSTFLDMTSHGMTTATSVAEAYGITSAPIPTTATINVALVLERANDPTALLNSDWGARQQQLEQLNNDSALWSTYGARTENYTAVTNALNDMGIPIVSDASGTGGYITSQDSRTIWVSLTPENFQTLFGTTGYQTASLEQGGMFYWEGHLSLPEDMNVAGLWFDAPPVWGTEPGTSNLAGEASVSPPKGALSIGNSLSNNPSTQYPNEIAENFYNFPLTGKDVPTATVGLVEPGIGGALPPGSDYTLQEGLNSYLRSAGIDKDGEFYVVAKNGEKYSWGNPDVSNPGERSLDLGVVAAINPYGKVGLYAGSGFAPEGGAYANSYTAYQSSFWDQTNNPAAVSSSFSIISQSAPDSPFAFAVRELFVDAALRNVSTFIANNDWGSSYSFSNGLANQNANLSSPYAVLVGGTSITTVAAAPHDPTVAHEPSPSQSVYGQAMAGHMSMLWRLIEGGLTQLPSGVSGTDATQTTLLESVWNSYVIGNNNVILPEGGLGAAAGSDGGVDTTQPTPWYQTAFGLTPTSANPGGGTGRGAPDVAANAGGNMFYLAPGDTMQPGDIWEDLGTSAATPLWASLAAQITTIFGDQSLPSLGYMNDLLYTAAAIAPASFNDITFGNNITSYYYDNDGQYSSGGWPVTLTGFGYSAAPGYDLTTGLGTPNGMLLARALTTIAHEQYTYGSTPDVLDATGAGGWTTPVSESLLVQSMSSRNAAVDVAAGEHSLTFGSGVSSAFAWTSQFAQQSLQADFDPQLVRLFDKQTHGWVGQSSASADGSFSVEINGTSTTTPQGTLTNDFGFVDFVGNDGNTVVRVASAVAVAETVGNASDQQAVVRVRQNGEDSLSLTFYRVDDHNGTIGGLRPGEAGYAEAALGRAYTTSTGGTSIAGPGYGNYGQAMLTNVDAGNIIAMHLVNDTSGESFWAFSEANEANASGGHVGHLWNYGVNTWGWEDTYGGGDRDYNDLVVQFDFTSASGNGWLV